MRKTDILISSALFILLTVSFSSATEEESMIQKLRKKFIVKEKAAEGPSKAVSAAPRQKKVEVKEKKKLTRQDKVELIKKNLENYPEIASLVPELKRRGSEKEGFTYLYQLKGKPETKLEDLDESDLTLLLTRTNQHAVRIRTEKIQKQLEVMRSRERIQRIPKPPSVSPQTPKPIQVPKVPQPPRVPSTTPGPSERK